MPRHSLRDLERFVRVGGHLQTTTIKDSPQEQGLPQALNPGQGKVVQEGAERAEEEQPTLLDRKTAAGRTRAGEAIDSRTTKKTVQAPKDKKSGRGREASKLDTGNRDATYGPPSQENLIDDSKAKVSIQGKLHDETGDSGIKDEQRTPHLKDDNRSTAPRQDVPGRQPFESQHVPRGPQDQDADSLSDPNPAGAHSPEPTSSPAQVRQRGEEPALVKQFTGNLTF